MEKRIPVIGICSSYEKTETEDRIFLNRDYLRAIRHFGGMPLVIPAEASAAEQAFLLDQCDGLLMTGGDDIDPTLYGETILNDTVCPAPERDLGEPRLLAMALQRDMPILGICRGLQILNVFLGGTLYQDLPVQLPSDTLHKMQRPYDRAVHTCHLTPDSPLQKLMGCQNIGVNSLHHQAVKDLAAPLMEMGRAPDGIIEAACKPDARFLWAVQWHPEILWPVEESAAKLFEAFISACQ